MQIAVSMQVRLFCSSKSARTQLQAAGKLANEATRNTQTSYWTRPPLPVVLDELCGAACFFLLAASIFV
eukprot:1198763-Pleurochrysis_carterae.AAC.3